MYGSKWSKTLVPVKSDSALLWIYVMIFFYGIHVMCWNILWLTMARVELARASHGQPRPARF